MMKALAIYTLVTLAVFTVYSLYFASVGDNSPFWLAISILCLPSIAFALLYLAGKR